MPLHHTLFAIVGRILLAFGLLEFIPVIISFVEGSPESWEFFQTACVTLFFGAVMYIGFGNLLPKTLSRREIYLVTTSVWVGCILAAALPLYTILPDTTFVDALFESSSGLTATGSTVLSGLDDMPKSILFWRALIQWVGGIGIVVFGILILPQLRVGGMELFRSESSDQSEKVVAKTFDFAIQILWIYAIISAACAILYYIFGMSMFDAVVHSMTTVATAGFSSHDASIAYFNSASIEWVAIVFMIAGAIPFVAYIRCQQTGSLRSLTSDVQVRVMIKFMFVVSILLTIPVYIHTDQSWFDSFRDSLFSLTSIVTTTGYVTIDYTTMGPVLVAAFLFLMMVGGCTGSTAGGIKIYRLDLMLRTIGLAMKKMLYPHGVFSYKYSGRQIDNNIIVSVMTFIGVFLISLMTFTVALALCGMGPLEAFTSAVTALANVGPGLAAGVGPTENFSMISDNAKVVMATAMLVGRLEFLTVLVLFMPSYWKQ